jgi:quinolinate synthase
MHQPFPSLLLRHSGVAAQGAFAEAQAAFLDPDPTTVQRLQTLLGATDAGVVAHFYMDAELQGACSRRPAGLACTSPTRW